MALAATPPATRSRTRKRHAKGTGASYVYSQLRSEILSLALAPGANLDEAQLVERFGLSRTPVREALIRLESDDLAILLPNRGAQVAPLDLMDFPRYMESLDLIQRSATRFAAIRRSADDLARIDAAREAFESAAGENHPVTLTETNRNFHVAIGDASNNPYIASFYRRLLDQGMRLIRIPFAYDPNGNGGGGLASHIGKVVKEHQEMVDAIARRDAARADALAHAHTELFRDRFLQYLKHNLARISASAARRRTPARLPTPSPSARATNAFRRRCASPSISRTACGTGPAPTPRSAAARGSRAAGWSGRWPTATPAWTRSSATPAPAWAGAAGAPASPRSPPSPRGNGPTGPRAP